MSVTHRSPADALTYIREALDIHLDWVHNALAEAYGVDIIDGEEYLPGVLNDVMSPLYALHREITDECVNVGDYRRENGYLYRPRTYSNGLPVYANSAANPSSFHLLNRPSDESSDSASVQARRAGMGVKDGDGCA